jgi:two-component system chemotaxis response regulator CheB
MEKDAVKRMYQLVIIGGSAGSLDVLLSVVAQLRPDLPVPVLVVVHRKQDNDNLMESLLSNKSTLPVKEAEDKEPLLPGNIYIAPADYHLLIEKNNSIALDASEKINFSRPSIDVSFQSAAEVCGDKLICILLSGANADGTEGLTVAKQAGALLIVQDPLSAEVSFMPLQALKTLSVDHIIRGDEIATLLNELV